MTYHDASIIARRSFERTQTAELESALEFFRSTLTGKDYFSGQQERRECERLTAELAQRKESEKPAILASGWGYWDITNYPYKGCFRRASNDVLVTVIGPGVMADEFKVRFPDNRIAIITKRALTL